MRQFSIILAVAYLLALVQPAEAQLFRWFGAKNQSSCPGGVCPTGNASRGNWYNRDGLSQRQHVELVHGQSTAGMSDAEIQAHVNSYHNTYGAGHPVRGAIADVARVVASPVQQIAENRVVRQTARYPAVSGGGVSYGSCGGLTVGSLDKDGFVITSVGPLSSPAAPSVESVEMRAPVGGASFGDRVAFRRQLMDVSRKARAAGTISDMDFYRILAQSRRPAKLQEAMEVLAEAAVEDNEVGSVSAINWDQLFAFMTKLLPLIIQLFGGSDGNLAIQSEQIDVQYISTPADDRELFEAMATTTDWTGLAG